VRRDDDVIIRADDEDDDVTLMLRVQQSGDTDAFATLAGRYRTPLRRFFAALLPDPSQADDFAQETLLRLWQCRSAYAPTGKFSAYVFQIGRHYYLNQRVRQRDRAQREVSAESQGDRLDRAQPSPAEPEAALLKRLEQARLRRAVEALPPHYRAVFTLSHLNGCKYAEIARHLDIPVGTVKSRMASAMRRLRAALSEEEER